MSAIGPSPRTQTHGPNDWIELTEHLVLESMHIDADRAIARKNRVILGDLSKHWRDGCKMAYATESDFGSSHRDNAVFAHSAIKHVIDARLERKTELFNGIRGLIAYWAISHSFLLMDYRLFG